MILNDHFQDHGNDLENNVANLKSNLKSLPVVANDDTIWVYHENNLEDNLNIYLWLPTMTPSGFIMGIILS